MPIGIDLAGMPGQPRDGRIREEDLRARSDRTPRPRDPDDRDRTCRLGRGEHEPRAERDGYPVTTSRAFRGALPAVARSGVSAAELQFLGFADPRTEPCRHADVSDRRADTGDRGEPAERVSVDVDALAERDVVVVSGDLLPAFTARRRCSARQERALCSAACSTRRQPIPSTDAIVKASSAPTKLPRRERAVRSEGRIAQSPRCARRLGDFFGGGAVDGPAMRLREKITRSAKRAPRVVRDHDDRLALLIDEPAQEPRTARPCRSSAPVGSSAKTISGRATSAEPSRRAAAAAGSCGPVAQPVVEPTRAAASFRSEPLRPAPVEGALAGRCSARPSATASG